LKKKIETVKKKFEEFENPNYKTIIKGIENPKGIERKLKGKS
jgi:hypothetical protein